MKTSYTIQLTDLLKELPPLPWDAVCVCEDVQLENMPKDESVRPTVIAKFDEDEDESAKLRAAYVNHCCNKLPQAVENISYLGDVISEVCWLLRKGDVQGALDWAESNAAEIDKQVTRLLKEHSTVNLIQMEYL